MAEIEAAKPLDHMQRITVRVRLARIEPAAIAQADGVDDERIAIPAADRIPEPCRFRILRQWTAVGEDLPEHHADLRFVKEDRLSRCLNDLELIDRINSRYAGRHAEAERVVHVIAPLALCLDARGPRRHLDVGGLQILCEVEEESVGSPSLPDAGEIGLAVRQPW